MTIHMQGSWTVSVKAKNAAYEQRFIISGADEGNGTYAGVVSPEKVDVVGDNWSIKIQNRAPRKPWLDSDDQITFPTKSVGKIQFDIQSNDAGGDEDFNDLILTCSTPERASEYILYGHASCYSGFCLFNPCFSLHGVLDTHEAFREAIRNPLLHKALTELYPEKVKFYERPPLPFPEPDPPPFTPMMLPLREQTAVPPQLGQEVRLISGPANADSSPRLAAGRIVNLSNQPPLSVTYDRVSLADLVGKLRRRCNVDPLPGYVLRFNEYDRSETELSGGPYLGEGNREVLGMAVTDRNGNYIFRFSHQTPDAIQEIVEDMIAGEDYYVQAMPDVTVELLDSTAPGGVAHETAPRWNIPGPLKRIDICIPCRKVPTTVTDCKGNNRFEKVGNIRIGIPENTFDSDGRITATDDSGNVPDARCAAWGGTLDLKGCLGDYKAVRYYTIRYRKYVEGMGWTNWEYYEEPFKLFNTDIMKLKSIGPFDQTLEISTDKIKAYDNIQGNNDWAASDWAYRASVDTTKKPFKGHIGPVEFWIQGYDGDGKAVSDLRDATIRLYVDNQMPGFDLDTVMIGEEETENLCAVYSLEGEPVPAVLTVRFKVIQEQGFLKHYELIVRKGNYSKASFPYTTTTGPMGETSAALTNSYVHVGGSSCADFVGTRPPDEITAVGDYATAYIIPDGGNWLVGEETVCAYAVQLWFSKRVTNGYNDAVKGYGPIQKLLAIKKE